MIIIKKVVVGISGGVDSAVAAYLLKKEGYDVIGLFMRNWDSLLNSETNLVNNEEVCSQEKDYNDAVDVCKKLDIPLYRKDFVKEYWDYVFKYFLSELEIGRTPNPDIMCNKYIKFDLFIKEAKKLGVDYVATGHYAVLKNNKLYKSFDKNKDQTYFLSQLSNKQLENILFPLGNIDKKEVRQIARKLDLSVAEKKDSTGICFIGERNFKKFLTNYIKSSRGDIVNIESKEILGKHDGLINYTIGQRRGLNIGGNDTRLFVVGKDTKSNTLFVALGDDNKYLYSDSALIDNMNYISDKKPTKCNAKFRYRQEDQKVSVKYINDNEILVSYQGIKAVTPGQACVLYDDNECIGGGIIKEVYKDNNKLWYL